MLTKNTIRALLKDHSYYPEPQFYQVLEDLSRHLHANITIMDNSGSIFFSSKTKINYEQAEQILPIKYRGKKWGKFIINRSPLTKIDLTALEIFLGLFTTHLH